MASIQGMNLMRAHSSFGFDNSEAFRRQAWWFIVLWALSPYSVQIASAAQVCTTNAAGQTVCHDKLSGGTVAAIVITILLVLLLCAGIYYIIRRTRAHRSNAASNGNWAFGPQIPALGYSSRRRRDAEEGDDLDDDKYLSVDKNQIQGPTWEARYDPSSAPLPGKSTWSSRLRGIKSGGRSGSEFGDFGYGPASAPGHGMSGNSSGLRNVPPVQKPKSAGADSWKSPKSPKRHWGFLIHGSQSKNGSKSAGPGPAYEPRLKAVPQARARASPGLQIIAEGHGGYYNSHSIVPPVTPHTPRTPSRLGTAPPVSAGPNGFSSAPTAPRTPRTPRTPGTPLTPRPAPAYSPVAPRGHLGAI